MLNSLVSRKKVVQHRRRASREAPAIPYPYAGASLLIRRLPNRMGRESPAPPYSRGADVGRLSSNCFASLGEIKLLVLAELDIREIMKKFKF